MEAPRPTTPAAERASAVTATRPRAVRARSRVALRALGLEQVWRLSTTAAAVRRGRATEAERVARVVETLGILKGAFAKAGQFAAVRHDLLPDAATRAFASLRDRVPPLPFERIRPVVEEELGADLGSLFREFEPEPVGAASIAQVHRASLPGGAPVVVKVQYPWLAASLPADLAILRVLVSLWTRRAGVRGRAERRRLFDEFARGLREELDFEREARVATEIASNLASDPQVLVPRPVPTHTARRVLTMDFVPAVRVDDAAGLARLGVAPGAALEILARAYARQVFGDGLFHADPHAGNLFVVDEPGASEKPRLLFVDFGLSRRLDPALRRRIRRGIHAVLRRDLDGFVGIMDEMGMIADGAEPGVRSAVASMFERLAGGEGRVLAMAGAQVLSLKDEAKALLQQTEGLQLPNDLLLFAKTLSYLFALGDELDPDVDLMRSCLPWLLRFLAEKDDE